MPIKDAKPGRTASYRFFTLLFLAIFAAGYATCAIVNFIADPFWIFNHTTRLNKVQKPFNEREQKTNYLTYDGTVYDSLLTGNSRVTFINQHDFKNEKVFNYALSAIAPSEFEDYINYFLTHAGDRVKTIYFGSSFASANSELEKTVQNPPSYYISKSLEPLHRLRMLFNLSLIPYSYRVIKENFYPTLPGPHYDRHNVAYIIPFSDNEKERVFNNDLNAYLKLYKNGFWYDRDKYRKTLRDIVEKHPKIRFVAFSPPVTHEMYCLVRKAGLERQYFEWVEDMTNIFGSFYHFEYTHKIAHDHAKFMDANHFLPEIGTIIVEHLQGREFKDNKEFGIEINRSNLQQQIFFLQKNMESCR